MLAAVGCGAARQATLPGGEPKLPQRAEIPRPGPLEDLVLAAVGTDPRAAAEATARLRSHGTTGLDAVLALAERQGVLSVLRGGELPASLSHEQVERFRAAIERTARQRDAHSSRLYWHTDLSRALSEAQALARPVLSLRLLGNLDEELSCANSRFFRAVLYANSELSRYLRDNYVLHWESVRPAPKITIDFGDGRRLERTITGNSIHYVLAPDGQVVDALPGLYAPAAFRRVLDKAERSVRDAQKLAPAERNGRIAAHRRLEAALLLAKWRSRLDGLNGDGPAPTAPPWVDLPSAADAAPRAMGKAAPEIPIVVELLPGAKGLSSNLENSAWKKLAALYREDAKLDAASRQLMFRKTGLDLQARSATPKPLTEAAFERLVQRFEASVAEDTARNEFEFRAAILGWLSAEQSIEQWPAALKALNARVYRELFLTPDEDRWLGLVEPDVFTALPNQGVLLGTRGP